jgi:Domain of unknown function (DUF5063)
MSDPRTTEEALAAADLAVALRETEADPMSPLPEATAPDADLVALADELVVFFGEFVAAVEALAAGDRPDEAVSLLLLEVSSVLGDGARLGAMVDVVPDGDWEPDAGTEPDVDGLREALHGLLDPVDSYAEVFDPYAAHEIVHAQVSDDLATTVSDLLHGIAHHTAGRPIEALWWWQYSYLSSWGPAASATLRALQSLVAHVRLGAPIEEDDLTDEEELLLARAARADVDDD